MSLINKVVAFLLLSLAAIKIQAQQQHQLKFILPGKNSNIIIPQFSSGSTSEAVMRDIGGRFSIYSSIRICAFGLWALYNKVDFGEGSESSTTAAALKSTDISNCTLGNSIPIPLASILSVKFLGNSNPSSDGVDIYTEANFIGGSWKLTSDGTLDSTSAVNGIRMGSLAMTGSSAWTICGDLQCSKDYSVCVDMAEQPGGIFIVTNTVNDSAITPWPLVVRKVAKVDSATCLGYKHPPLLTF